MKDLPMRRRMAPVTMMMLKTVRIASTLNRMFWVDSSSTRKLTHNTNNSSRDIPKLP
jgi:hypothetical protein